jgi:hypothetical protein
MELAQHVDPALLEQLSEPRALFRQEARVLLVLARPGEVDLLVRDVEVAADRDRRALGEELRRVRQHVVHELELDREALLRGGARGHVEADDREVAEVRPDRAALVGAVVEARAVDVAVGLPPREQRDARVALLRGAVPARAVPARRVQRLVDVVARRAQLLETEEVGPALLQPARETAPFRRADAVQVQRADRRHGDTVRSQSNLSTIRREVQAAPRRRANR